MELDLQSLFGLLCTHSCTHWLRPCNSHLPAPAFWLIYEGAIGQRTSLCNPLIQLFEKRRLNFSLIVGISSTVSLRQLIQPKWLPPFQHFSLLLFTVWQVKILLVLANTGVREEVGGIGTSSNYNNKVMSSSVKYKFITHHFKFLMHITNVQSRMWIFLLI